MSVALRTMTNMADELESNVPNMPSPTPRVFIVDLDSGQSPYPEDGVTLLERWANVDPPNNPTVGAITKTTASVQFGSVLGSTETAEDHRASDRNPKTGEA